MKFSVFFFSAEDQFSTQARYKFIMETAKYIDSRNYHAIWTPERHFQEFGGAFPSPAVLSAALSQVTQQLQLCAGCTVLPHHHPVRVAEEWALIDQLSGGRVGVGVASGWHKRDFVFYPQHHAERKTVILDQIKTIRQLWRGEEITQPGVDQEPTKVRTYPQPVQREIPMWLVCSTDPNVWITAGKNGLNILSLLDNWDSLEENIANYRKAREEAGYDPQTGWVTTAVHTFIGDDDNAVRNLVEEPMKQYLSTFIKATNDNNNLRQNSGKTVAADEQKLLLDAVFSDMYAKRTLFGSLEKCQKVVQRLSDIGSNEVACFIDFGLEFETVMSALPGLDKLKDLFSGADDNTQTPQSDAEDSAVLDYYKQFS